MKQKEFYDKTAEKYDSRHRNSMINHMRLSEEKLIKKYAFGKTLDIGCGTGHHLELANAIGLDISFPMLKEAKKKNCKKLIQGDVEQLPFSNNSLDTVLCLFTVLNLCDFEKSINEMKRVLKRSGRIIVSVASIWEREKKPLLCRIFVNPKPRMKKMRIEGFRFNFYTFTKKEFLGLFREFKLEDFKGIFIVQNPHWGWYRNFSIWEKIKLKIDKFQFLNKAARLYMAVFRKP